MARFRSVAVGPSALRHAWFSRSWAPPGRGDTPPISSGAPQLADGCSPSDSKELIAASIEDFDKALISQRKNYLPSGMEDFCRLLCNVDYFVHEQRHRARLRVGADRGGTPYQRGLIEGRGERRRSEGSNSQMSHISDPRFIAG